MSWLLFSCESGALYHTPLVALIIKVGQSESLALQGPVSIRKALIRSPKQVFQ